MAYKLLTNINIHAAFRTSRYERMPQFVQVVIGTQFLELSTYLLRSEREHYAFGGFMVSPALSGFSFPCVLLSLFFQHRRDVLRQ